MGTILKIKLRNGKTVKIKLPEGAEIREIIPAKDLGEALSKLMKESKSGKLTIEKTIELDNVKDGEVIEL